MDRIEPKREQNRGRTVGICLLLALLIVLSILFGSEVYDSFVGGLAYQKQIENRQLMVTGITASAAAASAAIAAVPDDSTTPIAEEVADVTQYMLLAMLALTVEGYLLRLGGVLAFRFLVPAALGLLILHNTCHRLRMRELGVRVLAMALCFALTVPISLELDKAVSDHLKLKEKVSLVTQTVEEEAGTQQTEKSFFEKAKDFFVSTIDVLSDVAAYAQSLLKQFMDAVVAMLISCFLAPILSLAILWTMLRRVLSSLFAILELPMDPHGSGTGYGRRIVHEIHERTAHEGGPHGPTRARELPEHRGDAER